MAEKSTADKICEAARECGVDPNDPVFRAKMFAALLAAGHFKKTST